MTAIPYITLFDMADPRHTADPSVDLIAPLAAIEWLATGALPRGDALPHPWRLFYADAFKPDETPAEAAKREMAEEFLIQSIVSGRVRCASVYKSELPVAKPRVNGGSQSAPKLVTIPVSSSRAEVADTGKFIPLEKDVGEPELSLGLEYVDPVVFRDARVLHDWTEYGLEFYIRPRDGLRLADEDHEINLCDFNLIWQDVQDLRGFVMTTAEPPAVSPAAHATARAASRSRSKSNGNGGRDRTRIYAVGSYNFGVYLSGLNDKDLTAFKGDALDATLAQYIEESGESRPHPRTVRDEARALRREILNARTARRPSAAADR